MPQSSYIVYIRNKRNEVTSKSVCNMTANNMLYNLYVKYADIKNESYKWYFIKKFGKGLKLCWIKFDLRDFNLLSWKVYFW